MFSIPTNLLQKYLQFLVLALLLSTIHKTHLLFSVSQKKKILQKKRIIIPLINCMFYPLSELIQNLIVQWEGNHCLFVEAMGTRENK